VGLHDNQVVKATAQTANVVGASNPGFETQF